MVCGNPPPALALPLKGGGDVLAKVSPSPSKGEGWEGGDKRRIVERGFDA
jgi:hypothetical protein